MKKIIITTLIILISISGWLFTSPFKYNAATGLYQLENKIVIDQPVNKVFNYLGNSANASTWSSYVNHIAPINLSEVEDGLIGSMRRCFKNADRKGIFWDEEIVKVKANKLRELSIFNLNGFIVETQNLYTQQQYYPVSERQTNLVFGLYKPVEKTSGFIDWLKMKCTGHYIALIFNKNLENIKKEVERLSRCRYDISQKKFISAICY